MLEHLAARNHKFGRQSGADDDGASGYSSYWKNQEYGAGDDDDIEEDYDFDDEEEDDDEEDDDDEEEEDDAEVENSLANLSLEATCGKTS